MDLQPFATGGISFQLLEQRRQAYYRLIAES
jgi:hypothetical protein